VSAQDDLQNESAPDEEELQHLREQLRAHRKRLSLLEIQAAKYGASTEPHIISEIAEIRGLIAPLEAHLIRATPAATRTVLLQARQQAMKAFYSQQWAEAEDLLAQVLQSDPDDDDLQKKLQEAQRHLELHAAYQAICELRAEGLWQAVLGALDDLAQQQPNYPDTQGLREWAEARQREEQQQKDATSPALNMETPHASLGAPTPAQTTQNEPQSETRSQIPSKEALLTLFERYKGKQGYHLLLTPKELSTIRERLELLPADEEVLAYIVTTMMGGLGDGVAFTTHGVAWRNGVMCTPTGASKHGYLPYDQFPASEFVIQPDNNIYLEADQAFNHTGWCELTSEQILALLNDIKKLAIAAAEQQASVK
jgi:hypothetical protein